MKQLLFVSLLAAPLFATAQELPQPSPAGKVEQIVGLTKVTVEYSRPSAKGRKIFGDLVPYGKVWRTGANRCTMFETSGPIKVEGQDLPAGIYSLFTIPSEDTWVFIFNKDTALWGEEDRKDEMDALRVKVSRGKTEAVETFTIGFDAVKDDHARMELSWENMLVGVDLYADATEPALANIKKALADPKATFGAYHGSARFCLDRNIQLQDALTWAGKSVSMERKYWNTHTYARALAANGKTKEAIAAAEESMKLAQEAKAEAYVKMNKEKIEEWMKTGK
ncbi:MAG: DUF2911 domain-containing protein [Flavobacteriales bacterium]|nr:DUF2911 domain-containing protein [Flavobacteriales bacterium]